MKLSNLTLKKLKFFFFYTYTFNLKTGYVVIKNYFILVEIEIRNLKQNTFLENSLQK